MLGFRREDVPVAIEGGGVEFRAQRGIDLRPALKGLPDDLCQCPHWGYVVKGKVRMHTKTGHQDYEAGQAFYWAPGHAPEILEDAEYVDSPTAELDAVIHHIVSQAPQS